MFRWCTPLVVLVAMQGQLAACVRTFDYDVPVSKTSPWPMMRRTAANDALSQVDTTNCSTAATPWRYQTGKGIFSSPVIGSDQSILVGSADQFFYSIHPNGTKKWAFKTHEIIDSAAAVTDHGTVVVPSADGHLVREPSHATLLDDVGMPDEHEGTHCWAAPPQGGTSTWFEGNIKISHGGLLLAGNDDQRMYGIEENGTERFAFFPGPIPFGSVWSHPAIINEQGDAVFGALDTFVYAVDAQVPALSSAAAYHSAKPFCDTGAVYVGSWDSNIYSLDAKTGSTNWKFLARDHIYASAALGRSHTGELVVYAASTDGTLYALDAHNGTLVWTFDILAPIRSSPVVGADGSVLFGAADGSVYCLDNAGNRRWSYDTTEAASYAKDINSSPALGLDAVYVGGYNGNIYSIPYMYCHTPQGQKDARCNAKPTGDLEPDGVQLYWVEPTGESLKSVTKPVNRAAVITLRLLVRKGGHTLNAEFSGKGLSATSSPPMEFDVDFTAHPAAWVNLVPRSLLLANQKYKITIVAPYTLEGKTDSCTQTFDFQTVDEHDVQQSLKAFQLLHLSPYLPPLITSLNQIGFDSLNFLGSNVHQKGDRFVSLVLGGLPDPSDATKTIIDPNSTALVAMDGISDGNSFVLSGAHLNLVTGGPVIALDEFRVASQVSTDGNWSRTTSMLARAKCLHDGLAGLGLLTFGLCNKQHDFVAVGTISGFPYSGPAAVAPSGISLKCVTIEETLLHYLVQVQFDSTEYSAMDHQATVLLIEDSTTTVVKVNYREALKAATDEKGNIIGTTLTVPTGALEKFPVRVVVVMDLYPVYNQLLSPKIEDRST